MKKIIKEVSKTIIPVIVCSFVVAASTFAQTWSPAPANPPSNNAPSPINVSSVGQSKSGNFTANVIGANGLCLKSDCITSWPKTSRVAAEDIKIVQTGIITNDTPGTASCGSGYKVVGGGYNRVDGSGDDGSRERAFYDYPNSSSSWTAYYKDGDFRVYAVCLRVQ